MTDKTRIGYVTTRPHGRGWRADCREATNGGCAPYTDRKVGTWYSRSLVDVTVIAERYCTREYGAVSGDPLALYGGPVTPDTKIRRDEHGRLVPA